jgi:small subunit ribosomal protein S17
VRGTVKSSKMDKTISVVVEHLARHPRYEKHVRRSSTFKAHDARNEAQVGDLVEIEETRPLSKTKHWRLVRVVKHALSAPLPEVESASVEPQAAP